MRCSVLAKIPTCHLATTTRWGAHERRKGRVEASIFLVKLRKVKRGGGSSVDRNNNNFILSPKRWSAGSRALSSSISLRAEAFEGVQLPGRIAHRRITWCIMDICEEVMAGQQCNSPISEWLSFLLAPATSGRIGFKPICQILRYLDASSLARFSHALGSAQVLVQSLVCSMAKARSLHSLGLGSDSWLILDDDAAVPRLTTAATGRTVSARELHLQNSTRDVAVGGALESEYRGIEPVQVRRFCSGIDDSVRNSAAVPQSPFSELPTPFSVADALTPYMHTIETAVADTHPRIAVSSVTLRRGHLQSWLEVLDEVESWNALRAAADSGSSSNHADTCTLPQNSVLYQRMQQLVAIEARLTRVFPSRSL
jgi:hypothetical protein